MVRPLRESAAYDDLYIWGEETIHYYFFEGRRPRGYPPLRAIYCSEVPPQDDESWYATQRNPSRSRDLRVRSAFRRSRRPACSAWVELLGLDDKSSTPPFEENVDYAQSRPHELVMSFPRMTYLLEHSEAYDLLGINPLHFSNSEFLEWYKSFDHLP